MKEGEATKRTRQSTDPELRRASHTALVDLVPINEIDKAAERKQRERTRMSAIFRKHNIAGQLNKASPGAFLGQAKNVWARITVGALRPWYAV